MVVVNRGATVF